MKNAESAGQQPCEQQQTEQPRYFPGLPELIHALHQQTEAITRLAMSNEALVAAMADEEPEDLEAQGPTYLDGSVKR